MFDKLFYPFALAVAIAMISLALVWPQGIGARSPAPFGHEIKLPDIYRVMAEKEERRKKKAAEKAERDAEKAAQSASATSSAAPN